MSSDRQKLQQEWIFSETDNESGDEDGGDLVKPTTNRDYTLRFYVHF